MLTPIPLAAQHEERWANGAGSTRVVLRLPDTADWKVRVSIARVDADGPFSELPGVRRTLIALDAPIELEFPDRQRRRGLRGQALRFAGAPAPFGRLPEGPTRDFNLMLRGGANAEAMARTLVGTMVLPAGPHIGWLCCLDSGHATLHARDEEACVLAPGDAAYASPGSAPAVGAMLEGAGEILLVKLYA